MTNAKCYLSVVLCTALLLLLGGRTDGAGVAESNASPAAKCSPKTDPFEERFHCHPDGITTRESCLARGCCFSPGDGRYINETGAMLGTIPRCYFPIAGQSYPEGYHVVSTGEGKTPHGYPLIWAELVRKVPLGIRDEVMQLRLEVWALTRNMARVRITDSKLKRWEPPLPSFQLPAPVGNDEATREYTINLKNDILTIQRKISPQSTFFKVDLSRIIYSNQVLQITQRARATGLYGIGQRIENMRLDNDNYLRITLWNTDIAPRHLFRLYGSHSMHMAIENEYAQTSGVYLLNSNAMDIDISPGPSVTYRTVGGIFDFFLFSGPAPMEIVKAYYHLVGLPVLPPFWSLGFQLCRWGYKSLDDIITVVNRTLEAGIPFDVQWADIDHMDRKNDFTIKKEFSQLPEFVEKLHRRGLRFVPIEDPYVSSVEPRGTYPPFDDGLAMDIFVKNHTNQILYGSVWNEGGSAVYPDFTNPNTSIYWSLQIKKFYDKLKFDGLWIDMNEPSNFKHGSVDGCPNINIENLPYQPDQSWRDISLVWKTLCLSAKHHIGIHNDVHQIASLYQVKATHDALKAIMPTKRPFVLTRATFPGSGHYGINWDGDSTSLWDHLRYSIHNMINFNILAIPMVGTDICGFLGDTTEELCARWQELGAFYPFSRNHNIFDSREQDPVALGPRVVAASRNALNMRYRLLPLLYTLLYNAHRHGEPVIRALFLEYPLDKNTWSLSKQFMWGGALMIVPVTEPEFTKTLAYIPEGKWYCLQDWSRIKTENGTWMVLDAPIGKLNVFLRGGHIVPTLPPRLSTNLLREGKFSLMIGLGTSHAAIGQLFWDDGESVFYDTKEQYNLIRFTANKGIIEIIPEHIGYNVPMMVDEIVMLGVKHEPSSIVVGDESVSKFSFESKLEKLIISFERDMRENITVRLQFPDASIAFPQKSRGHCGHVHVPTPIKIARVTSPCESHESRSSPSPPTSRTSLSSKHPVKAV